MAFAFFHLPADAGEAVAASLNRFLRTHQVVRVSREWCPAPPPGGWAFCLEYAESPAPVGAGANAKVDYRDLLPPEQFAIFARLRTLRKTLAEREGQPVFAIFTNAHLAEMAQRGCQNLAELQAIPGIGEARLAKYGAEVLDVLQPNKESA